MTNKNKNTKLNKAKIKRKENRRQNESLEVRSNDLIEAWGQCYACNTLDTNELGKHWNHSQQAKYFTSIRLKTYFFSSNT